MINSKTIMEAIEFYGEHAQKFARLTLKDAETHYKAIHGAIGNQDYEALGLAAHSLKSIMRQAGAHEVADEALLWEQKSKAFSADSSELKKLDDSYDETKKLLEWIISQNRHSLG